MNEDTSMSATVGMPINVSAITLGDGAHSPVGSPYPLMNDSNDTDVNTLIYPYTQPKVISSAANGNLKISMPANVSSITINGVVYTPDGSQYNTITGPAADFTIVVTQGFFLVTENT